MWLIFNSPQVAYRDCNHCQKFVYNEKTGRPEVFGANEQFVPRPKGTAPCRLPVGCPRGTPENSKALNRANELAYQHYQECAATGLFPHDPIVKRNAGIIRQIEQAAEKMERQTMYGLLTQLATTTR